MLRRIKFLGERGCFGELLTVRARWQFDVEHKTKESEFKGKSR